MEGEDGRAMACYEKLVKQINGMGFYSYRLGIQSMAEMNSADSYAKLIRLLKDTLDPAGVLAPGRYEPAELPQVRWAKATHI